MEDEVETNQIKNLASIGINPTKTVYISHFICLNRIFTMYFQAFKRANFTQIK